MTIQIEIHGIPWVHPLPPQRIALTASKTVRRGWWAKGWQWLRGQRRVWQWDPRPISRPLTSKSWEGSLQVKRLAPIQPQSAKVVYLRPQFVRHYQDAQRVQQIFAQNQIVGSKRNSTRSSLTPLQYFKQL